MSHTLAQTVRHSRGYITVLIHIVVILSMLLPGLAYTPARAAPFNQADDGTPTPSLTPEASETPEAGGTPAPISTAEAITTTQEIPTSTATATLTPTVEIPTATPTVTPTLPGPTPTITATVAPTETVPVAQPSPTPAPGDPEALSTLGLNLDANDSQATPGGLLSLYWQAANWQASMSGLSMELSAPSGLSTDDAAADLASGVYRLPVDTASGEMQWQIPADLPGPYTFSAALTLDGTTVVTKTITIAETGLTQLPTGSGTAEGLDGTIRVTFPEKAAADALDVRIRKPVPASLPATPLSEHPFEIVASLAKDGPAVQIHQFDNPLTIEMAYNGKQDARIYYFDLEKGEWQVLPTYYDREAGVLRAWSDHLTAFDAEVNDWETAMTPTMEGYQVGQQTGAANYSFPIWTPPGPAGLQPSLSLSYNSQVVDGSIAPVTQASWVGMGWSMDTGAITRNTHGTTHNLGDDTYSLVANGVSGTLIKDAGGTYHFSDENFYKVVKNSNNWEVWDKTGTKYVFGDGSGASDDYRAYFVYCDGGGFPVQETKVWPLVEIVNKEGQKITFQYYRFSRELVSYCSHQSAQVTVHLAVYPTQITYPNAHYQVVFNRSSDRTDFDKKWDDATSSVMYEEDRLSSIEIKHDADGSGAGAPVTVRTYTLSYNEDVFPNVEWSGANYPVGGRTFTLESILTTGLNSATLPSPVFTYDSLHLIHAENGYGGNVDFTYEATPWYEVGFPEDTTKIYTFTVDSETCQTWENGTEDDPCQYYNGNGPLVVQGGAYKSILRDAVQAGGVYSFTVELWKIPNTTISTDPSFGFQYGASSFEGVSIPYTEANNSTSNNPVKRTVQIKLPGTTSYSATFGTNPQTTAYPRLMIYCQNCLVGKFDVTMLTARYRVVSRTIVDDVTDTSQTFSYEYDEAATNDPAHSAAVAAEDPDDDNDLYADPYTDYRGSAMSREIGPVGTDGTRRITTTWYAQDDDKKGQSVASMVGTRDFYQQFESTSWSTYDPDWDYNGAAPVFERVDGDIAAKVNNSAADWTKGLYRPTTSLADGEGVTVQFRLGSTGMQSVLAVASGTYGTGSYIRWGLRYASGNIYFHTCTTSESTCNDGSSPPVVLSGVSANTWYVAQIIIDHDQEFLARVWERNNLVHVGRYQQDLNLATTNWKFIQKSKSGTTWLDEYSEGKVYSFSTTGYSSTIQHGEDLDANLEDYLDLAINWTRPVTSTNMNFNGDGAWIGTRTISKYEAADQGGTQYGNQTHVIESKWSGSAWQDYRATRTWYYPYTPTGKYLVGLPGVTKRYKCGGADCDYSSEDLLNMQWYLYDGQTKYWVPPASPTGKLTTQRTFVCFANDSNVCYDGYDSDYKRQMYSDTQFEYDDWGNTVKTKVYSGYGYYAIVTGDSVLASTGLRETTACYGNSGKPTGCTDDGYYTYKLWEKSPLTASTTQTTNWSYSGALWNGSSYTGYTLGVPVSEQGPNGVNTKITAEYDYFGRLSKIIKPGDSSTYPTLQAVYYDSWQPMLVDVYQRITAGTGTIYSQRKFYNGLGQVIQVQTPRAEVSDNSCSSDGDTAPDICDLLVDSGYDGYGQVITQTVPYAVEDWYSGMPGYPTPYRGRNFDDSPRNYTSTVYDALGRSTTATAPDGTSSVTSYPATPNGFTGYSETRVKDARNNTTRSISDVWGHTYQVIPLNGDSDTSPINPSVTYSYNELDQLLTAVRGGATVTLSYDYAGRKIKQIDPDLGTWVYNFDATGNLTSQKDARCSGSNCVTISYTYDLASRLTQKSYTIPSGLNVAPTTTMSYGYDNGTYGIGQRTSMTDGSGSTAWTYDSRGRVTQESKVITGSGTYVTQYTYNSANQVVTMRYPADNAGGLGETLTMAYNAQNTIKNVLSNTNSYYYLEQAFYDAAGRIDQLYLGAVNTVNNPVLVTNYDYYAWTSQGGRLQYLKSGVWGSLTSLQNLSYTYDAVGNVETILDGNNSNQKQCFSYDNLYRLTKATTYQDTPKGCSTQLGNGNYTEDYEYSDDDPNPTGNLSSKSGVGDYTYDPTLKHAVTATGNGWSFGYDANGNMITRNVGNAYSLSYDAENRLDKVKKDGVAIARFIYDADANRVQSVITGTTTATTVYIGNYYEETFDNNTFSPIEINDPGFETGTGWSQVVNASYPNTSYYRSTWGTSTPHSGSYGYALSNQAYGWLQSDAISVLPNTQYDLYAWVKGEIDGEDSNGAWLIRAIYYNSGGGIISTPDIASGGPGTISNTYAQKGNRVTTPANTVSVVIQLQFYHNSGWVTYDDVSLIQVGNSTNLVANPGFETTSNWTENRAGGYSGTSLWRNTWGTAVPHGGSYAYVISNHAYAYLQSDAISVLPNTEYDLYAWVKGEIDGDDSNGAWIIRAVYYNSSGGAISYQNAANGGPGTITNTYAQKGGRVTTPANTATMRIQLQDYHNSGWVTYDDVTLIQVGYSTNLAPNPGFETSSNWTANAVGGYPGTSLYRSTWGTAAPHGGSYAYALSNHAYGYLESNSIVVRAGTDYDVYAWVRGEIDADDSYGDWIIRVQFYNASGTPISYVDADRGAVSALTTTYQQQGGRVTAPASAASMKIQFWNYMNSGWVTFDDVSVAAEVTRTSYYYAGATRIAMRTGSGSGTTGLKWMGADQLNSTSLVTTDVNATNATKQTYKAWGENRYPTTSTLPTTMRYTGQRHESSLGIYYYGARWYDPSLGRFLSPDSIIPQSQGVQAWDRYAGMNNNPVRYNDPSGHWINVVLGAAIGAAVGATLYSINTARSGQDWNLGQALTVGATGAAAGALISTGIGAGAGLAMFTGIGLASGGGGYLAANILTANQFDTSDFAIASGVGAASGYLGPSVATTLPGAMALGGVSNVAQYGLTQAANGEDITATGVAWAVGTGMFGGAVGGKYSKVDFDSLTRPTVRIGGNTYRPGSIGYDPEAFGYLAKDALLRKLPGGFTKAFLGGVFLNLPQEPESCPSEGAC